MQAYSVREHPGDILASSRASNIMIVKSFNSLHLDLAKHHCKACQLWIAAVGLPYFVTAKLSP